MPVVSSVSHKSCAGWRNAYRYLRSKYSDAFPLPEMTFKGFCDANKIPHFWQTPSKDKGTKYYYKATLDKWYEQGVWHDKLNEG